MIVRIMTAVAAAVLLAGCGLSSPDSVVSASEFMTPPTAISRTGDLGSPASTKRDAVTSPATQARQVGQALAAARSALAEHEGSAVVGLDLNRAHGTTVWQVTVVSADGRWEVDVDLATGSVLGDRSDDPGERDTDLDRLSRAALDHAAALDVALGLHDGSRLAELELDDDDGRLVWDAEIVTAEHQKYDVVIDAVTGDVVTNKLDD